MKPHTTLTFLLFSMAMAVIGEQSQPFKDMILTSPQALGNIAMMLGLILTGFFCREVLISFYSNDFLEIFDKQEKL